MRAHELTLKTPVVVSNLLRVPDYNGTLLDNWKPGADTPRFLPVTHRRLGATGVIKIALAGYPDSNAFIVTHDDGTDAVYHCSELVTVAALSAQTGGVPGTFVPLHSETKCGIRFEVYEGIDPATLPRDYLITAQPHMHLPTMDAIDAALKEAQAHGARTVVLPFRDFKMHERLSDDQAPADLLHMLDIMAEVAGVKFDTIKVAL